jgi:hypothetical protein
MPAERLPMRQVREVLRLKYVYGHSGHRIAVAVGISRYTVGEYLRRAAAVGITWPVPSELDDTALERKLFTPPGRMAAETVRSQPDWLRIHAEMRRAGRHAAVALGGVSSRATGWIRLQPVLRSPRRLAGSSVAHHAAEPSSRRAPVRGLCRAHRRGH